LAPERCTPRGRVARVFVGGKTPSFYWRNGFFWVELALFALVFVLEAAPMIMARGVWLF
jgi:uncharacterized membrane protein